MDVVLKLGMRGPLVREAQGLINSYFGKIKLQPDSSFGPRTDAVVREFQAAIKIKADGVIGPTTWSALRRRGQTKAVVPAMHGLDLFDIHQLEKSYDDLRRSFEGRFTVSRAAAAPTLRPATFRTVTSPMVSKAPANSARGQAPAKPVSVTDFKNFQRLSFEGYAGRGYVIKEFRKFEGHAIKLIPKLEIREPGAILGDFKNECAQFVQYFGVPNTRNWRRGPRVCDFKVGELPIGTVIATLRDGKYYSDYSGRSHVGIYLSHTDYSQFLNGSSRKGGVTMMDQYNKAPITTRTKIYDVEADTEGKATKPWTDAGGKAHRRRMSWTSDGEEYYVLLTI